MSEAFPLVISGVVVGVAVTLLVQRLFPREWGALSGNPEPTIEHDEDAHLAEWQRARRGMP